MGRFQRVVCVSQAGMGCTPQKQSKLRQREAEENPWWYATPRVRSRDLCAESLPLYPLHYHRLYALWPMDGTNADRTASCLFLLLGPASRKMGHMFWLQTGVPDVPAASQLTLAPLGTPLGSVFLQAARGCGLEHHQNGRILRTDRFLWVHRPPDRFARSVWRVLGAYHRAQRATPRAGTPAAAGSLTVSGRKRVLSLHSFKIAKYGP